MMHLSHRESPTTNGRSRAPAQASRNVNAAMSEVCYWLGLPARWARQMVRNGHDIMRVLDLTRFRPLPAGLVGLDHPWVTGIDPRTGELIWPRNVIFRTPRSERLCQEPDDHAILEAVGRFLARRVRQSAMVPEIPQGLGRRMPHAVNYMHGSSHYNSGIVLLNDFEEGYQHFTDWRFARELKRFVRTERREVLIVFRDRDYTPRDFARFSCCLRTRYCWFCNPNGPAGNVLWGNFSPFPAANLITGAWADDVYRLRRFDAAEAVLRPAIAAGLYFTGNSYRSGLSAPRWPESLLAWLTYHRVRLRGARGGMFFVDRRRVYADQFERCRTKGLPDCPQAEWTKAGSRTTGGWPS